MTSRFIYGTMPFVLSAVIVGAGILAAPQIASATTPADTVTVVWSAKGTAQWPVEGQTFVASKDGTPVLDVEFIKAEAAKLGCGFTIQGDLYADDAVTAALIAGGKLYGPSNPAESWPGGSYKSEYSTVFYTGDCPPSPEYPGDKITYEDTERVQDCELGTASWLHLTYTSTGTLVANVWVFSEPVETGREEVSEPMTAAELAACAPVVPPVDPPTDVVTECDPDAGECLATTGVETDAALLAAGTLLLIGYPLIRYARRRLNRA